MSIFEKELKSFGYTFTDDEKRMLYRLAFDGLNDPDLFEKLKLQNYADPTDSEKQQVYHAVIENYIQRMARSRQRRQRAS